MSDATGKFCRPAAREAFVAQLSRLETTEGLLNAAIAVSMHELTDVQPGEIQQQLNALADRVRGRVAGDSTAALLANLHGVMFEEECFGGNVEDYFNADNSYIPRILQSKRGLPITLTLIYKYVAERLGLIVHGINTPAHFLASVQMDRAWTLVDPFFGGRILTRAEAIQQIEQMSGRSFPLFETELGGIEDEAYDSIFQIANHRDWLARIIRNLRAIFDQSQRERDVQAMIELFDLL